MSPGSHVAPRHRQEAPTCSVAHAGTPLCSGESVTFRRDGDPGCDYACAIAESNSLPFGVSRFPRGRWARVVRHQERRASDGDGLAARRTPRRHRAPGDALQVRERDLAVRAGPEPDCSHA